MTAVQAIAVVMIRLWAVGHIILTCFGLFQSFGFLYSDQQMFQGSYGYLQVATFTLLLVFWALVLSYSRTVTAWVLPPVQEADHSIRIAPEDLISVGTFLVGVYYLTQYVPEFLQSMSRFIGMYSQGGTFEGSGNLLQIASRVIAILIALWLVLRPNHLVRLFNWLRSAGRPEERANQMPKAE